ncbi:MAG: hypothetical protein CK426_08280 [Legionella sp.]|nr:MAG: hypothetical protein CK423_01185 [Legionella sp.]PJD97426.1 MAG: hypothetical protein CK426_08280 [Legionella sp.]
MFYGDSIQDTRDLFFISWSKYLQKQTLLPLEQQLVQVILDHPEYQEMMAQKDLLQDHRYFPELGETNPFLHMGLHLAIREQITTNRPEGISPLFQSLVHKYQNALSVEHLMMEQLAECLWLAQKNSAMPDEQHYLERLRQL